MSDLVWSDVLRSYRNKLKISVQATEFRLHFSDYAAAISVNLLVALFGWPIREQEPRSLLEVQQRITLLLCFHDIYEAQWFELFGNTVRTRQQEILLKSYSYDGNCLRESPCNFWFRNHVTSKLSLSLSYSSSAPTDG